MTGSILNGNMRWHKQSIAMDIILPFYSCRGCYWLQWENEMCCLQVPSFFYFEFFPRIPFTRITPFMHSFPSNRITIYTRGEIGRVLEKIETREAIKLKIFLLGEEFETRKCWKNLGKTKIMFHFVSSCLNESNFIWLYLIQHDSDHT